MKYRGSIYFLFYIIFVKYLKHSLFPSFNFLTLIDGFNITHSDPIYLPIPWHPPSALANPSTKKPPNLKVKQIIKYNKTKKKNLIMEAVGSRRLPFNPLIFTCK